MNRLVSILALALAACGPSGSGSQTMPTLPGDGDDNTAKPGTGEVADDPWAGRDDLIETPPAQPPVAVELPPIERFTLSNGLEVIVVPNDDLPVVGYALAVKAGGADEPRDKVGLASFTAGMLTKGTKKRKAEQIAESIDFVGGSLGADATFEATLVSCQALSKDANVCLDLMSDVVINPTFPESEMETIRDGLLTDVRARLDNAGALADANVQNELWGDDHPRGWPMSARTVGAITRGDLVSWHGKWFLPNNAVLAIAGDVDTKTLKKDLERRFRGWRKGSPPRRGVGKPAELDGVRIRLVDKPDQTQAHIRVAHFGIAHDDPDFFATQVMNYSLGSGAFSSRLMKVVRSEGGKTYGAWSRFDRNATRGAFVAGTFTRTAETAVTTQLVLDELAKMQADGPTADERADAIAYITGSYASRFESAADIANAVLGAYLHGFDDAYVRDYALKIGAVTLEDARKAAAERLDPENLVIVIVGNAKEIAPQLDAKGWSYTVQRFNEPIAKWERDAAEAERTGPVSAEDEKKARGILDAALAAKGGKKKLAAVKTMVLEGDAKVKAGPQAFEAKVSRTWAAPGNILFVMEIPVAGVTITSAITDDAAWQRQQQGGQQVVQELTGDDLVEAHRQVWRDAEFVLLRHTEKGTVVRLLPDEQLQGKTVHVVAVSQADGGGAVKLYIDADTNLLVQMTYDDGNGGTAVESFDDYRAVKGIKVAHSRSLRGAQVSFSLTFTKVEVNGKVDPKAFAKPEE